MIVMSFSGGVSAISAAIGSMGGGGGGRGAAKYSPQRQLFFFIDTAGQA